MGNESMNYSESNSLKTDSTSSSNTGEGDIFETLNFSEKNNNTLIKRVWIVKRAIDLNDIHVKALDTIFFLLIILYSVKYIKHFKEDF